MDHHDPYLGPKAGVTFTVRDATRFVLRGRAYLTMLPDPDERPDVAPAASPTAARALELLASPRFARRPQAAPEEVRQRIDTLRNDWDHR